MTCLLVLVLVSGALLTSTEAQQDYHTLREIYKEAVKLGIKKVHEHVKNHLNFYSTRGEPESNQGHINIEFLIKATQCDKSQNLNHRDDCKFLDNRPLINCNVCGKVVGQSLVTKETFVDCVLPKKFNDAIKKKRLEECGKYTVGGANILTLVMEEDPEIDCLGCF